MNEATLRASMQDLIRNIAERLCAQATTADMNEIGLRVGIMTTLLTAPDSGYRYVLKTEPAVTGATTED